MINFYGIHILTMCQPVEIVVFRLVCSCPFNPVNFQEFFIFSHDMNSWWTASQCRTNTIVNPKVQHPDIQMQLFLWISRNPRYSCVPMSTAGHAERQETQNFRWETDHKDLRSLCFIQILVFLTNRNRDLEDRLTKKFPSSNNSRDHNITSERINKPWI